ncbi:uncharacterized protein LOC127241990 [Andrographis paniculata]|uniref:uncharacterized protein LOC127241990 n=1 Tax=Andrographis paniculata TaxID=175694 RepID=UPI0021E9809F|nr:uncharacterized protein LOC127241990 [Andrographis paniculata]
MAISIRRALTSSRHLFCALRAASVCSQQNLHSSFINHSHESAFVDWFSTSSATISNQFNARRRYAKGRKQHISKVEEAEEDSEWEEEDEDDDDSDEDDGVSDLVRSVKATANSQMEAAIEALSRELSKLRTGRASAGMLDHITVEHYGVKTPLNRMAVVSVLDPKTLSVTPYDPNDLKELEKAILSSPLGLNPKADNQRLLTPIPPLTKEHMQAVCKVVAKSSEDVKQSIRRARQKALDSIKKAAPKKKDKDKSGSSITEDDAKRLEKEIDELTKKFIKTAEDICKAKEKEIRAG